MLTFNASKSNFFDRDRVIRAIGGARLRVLKEYGRRVRRRAQQSLKYSEQSSAPGSPPAAHKTGHVTRKSKSTGKTRVRSVSYLREFLFFAYDDATKSVVVGPVRLNSTVSPDALPALEYGGSSRIVDRGKRRSVNIRARPFMRPADAAERPGLPALWKDSVR